MSDHRYRNKHRSLWPPRRVNTRLSASQGAYYDEAALPRHFNDNPSVVASSAAMDIPPDTVIVHVPGVTAARTATSDGHSGKFLSYLDLLQTFHWITGNQHYQRLNTVFE